MKVSYRELLLCANDLVTGEAGSFARFRAIQKPIKTAARMPEIRQWFEKQFANYMESREELCKQHGEMSEDKTQWVFGENGKAYDADHRELLATTHEFPFPRIRVRDLLSSTSISDEDLELLSWLIDYGQPIEETPKDAPVEKLAAEARPSDGHSITECEGRDIEGNDLLDLEEEAEAAAA